MEKKTSVLEAVKKILQEQQLSSQEELRENLSQRGFDVTQSTVSRALKKLGAVRTYNEENQAFYALPAPDELPSVSSTLLDLVVEVQHNENCIVVTTKPGSASLIARHVDYQASSILGTVAGDDCFFALPQSVKKIDRAVQEVKEVLGLDEK